MDENERRCSTCHYYDPVDGVCKKTEDRCKAYDQCEEWKDWEEKW